MTLEREQAFRALYAEHFDAVLGFALRRCEQRDDAADVTAETFLVAWRRLTHVPAGDGDPAVALRRGAAGAGQPAARDAAPRQPRRGGCARSCGASEPDPADGVVVATDVRDGDAAAQRARPGGARAAPVGGPRAAGDRRGPRPDRPSWSAPGSRGRGRGCATCSATIRHRPDITPPTDTHQPEPDQEGAAMSDHETHRWTDEAVAALPLAQGRAELLEEIMSTPSADTPTATAPTRPDRPSPRRWAVPLAAAAAVAALAAAPLWRPRAATSGHRPGRRPSPRPRRPATQLVLEAPGLGGRHDAPVDPERAGDHLRPAGAEEVRPRRQALPGPGGPDPRR